MTSSGFPDAVLRVCALVPTYNHHRRLRDVVTSLIEQSLDVIIVDDGSAAPTGDTVRELAAALPGVEALRLERNGGKGAAMVAGFRRALEHGYTHVLQIDADGQHEPAMAAAFLARAQTRPDAVISGAAVYDETVPKARKFGRYVTHVCVWAETASLAISDSMCGFRLYPLRAVEPLLRSNLIGGRMEFDTEILVHLAWRGTPVEMLPVKVVYPAGNTSNFRMLRDNVRISWMHTRLLAQAPFRLLARSLGLVG